ncbi:MAG TPA: hypothetical protein VFN30_03470 [Chitinophagaceae bacterium]|nr:hypothetical protein [Chitinophagaceae bacterium]
MMEKELIKIWQSSPNQERIKLEKSRLMIGVQSSIDDFHKKIKYRDLIEQIAVLVVIPVFAYSAYAIPYLLTKVASILIIGYVLFVAIRLRNAKKHKPGALTETYLEYLHKTRDYLVIQKRLLDSVLYWYILPGVALTMLFVFGFGITGRLKPILKIGLLNIVLAVVTYYLNKRAAKKGILPRISKVNELISVLENS